MSIKVMTWVWDHSRSKNGARLVLLALADNASEDGRNAYPSIAELQRKTNLSERAVQTSIGNLVQLGELEVSTNAGRGGTNLYRVIMAPPTDACPVCGHGGKPCGGVGQDLPGGPADTAPGTVLEPSVEPKTLSEGADEPPAPTAQTIMAGFIDWLRGRTEPIELTPSVIARYGKAIKALLGTGYDVDTIKRALALQTEKGKAGWPSMLDSFCVEVQNRPVSAPPAARKTFTEMREDHAAARRTEAQLVDELMERYPNEPLDRLIAAAREYLAQQTVAPSTAVAYIEGVVTEPHITREVTS